MTMTMNDMPNFRFPAEWEYDCAILLAWPHADTDWNYMIDEVRDCYIKLITAITKYHPVFIVSPNASELKDVMPRTTPDRIFLIDLPTNDTWIRDYGPLTMLAGNGDFILRDFCFNGWGMKFAADRDNLVNSCLCEKKLFSVELINNRDFVLEGGGIESDGNGSLMTTSRCQLSPNRNAVLTRPQIEQKLKNYFNADNLIWIDHGYLAGDDTDSHIDTLARFAPHSTIVYTGCQDQTDEHFTELSLMQQDLKNARNKDGLPYNLIELPLPDPIFDEDGQRLPATYANFLVTPDAVFMPVYGQPRKDQLAAQILSIAYERPVETIDCNALIKQHGSLHCATMQIPLNSISVL